MPYGEPDSGLSRIVGIFLSVALLAGAAGWYWYYRLSLDDRLAAGYQELAAVNELKATQIVQWYTERLADARSIAESPYIRRSLAAGYDADETDSIDRMEALREQLHLIEDAYGYSSVYIVDLDGRRIVPGDGESMSPHPDLIERAVVRKTALLSKLYRLDDTIYIDTVAPIHSGTGDVPGVVVMRMDAGNFLFPLIRTWPVPNEMAESLLVRRDGDVVRFLSDTRFQHDAALTLDIPVDESVLGNAHRLDGPDYRGVPTIAKVREVPGTGWLLLAKMDRRPLAIQTAYTTGITMALATLVIVIVVVVMSGLYRRRQATLYRQLYQSEQQLQESANLLRIASRVARLAGWSADVSTGRVDWSRELSQIYNLRPDITEITVDQVLEAASPEWRDTLNNAWRTCVTDGISYDLEVEMLTVSDRRIWVRVIGEPVRDETGQVIRVQGAVQEVTERKHVEQELKRAHNLFEKTIDSLNEAVFLVDPASRTIIRCSEAVRAIFGYDPEELVGHTTRCLHLDEEHFTEFGRLSEQVLQRDGAFHGEFRMKRRDGTTIDTENTVKELNDESGWATGVVSVVRDISERRRAEAEQEQLQIQLLQSQKMEAIGRLAGGLAHDFNNMLSVILGYTDMTLEQFETDHPVRHDLMEVHSAAERSAELTRQLLAFARQQSASPEILNLNDTVASMLKMLGRLIGEHIELQWKPGADLWKVKIDPTQVDQVLANLMVNARDAIADTGTVTIETWNAEIDDTFCERHRDAEPGEYVVLAIGDTGHGMSKDLIGQIFEPFFTTKEQGLGTGLGLATVFGIVKQNHGFIDVDSEVDHGTKVKVYIPRCVILEDAVSGATAELEAAPTTGTETVLLVEDEEALLSLGRRTLERLGYTILATKSPAEAISWAEEYEGDIDLLLTDVVMPEINGRELWVKLDAIRPNIKVLFMSGYTADAIARHGVLDDGVMFIQKPYTGRSLAAKLREVLDSG